MIIFNVFHFTSQKMKWIKVLHVGKPSLDITKNTMSFQEKNLQLIIYITAILTDKAPDTSALLSGLLAYCKPTSQKMKTKRAKIGSMSPEI